MKVSSIQPSIYRSISRVQPHNSISSKGRKGALAGAAGVGGTFGLIALAALGGPAALLIGGVTAILGANAGNHVENDIESMKKEEKEKQQN